MGRPEIWVFAKLALAGGSVLALFVIEWFGSSRKVCAERVMASVRVMRVAK